MLHTHGVAGPSPVVPTNEEALKRNASGLLHLENLQRLGVRQVNYEGQKELIISTVEKAVTFMETLNEYLEDYISVVESCPDLVSETMRCHLKGLLKMDALGKKNIAWVQSHRSETNKVIRSFAHQFFDDRENIVTSINHFMAHLKQYGLSYEGDLFCQVDKIYRGDEIKIKLLKYLQKPRGTREKIADHFNMSSNAINNHLTELQDGCFILGSRVKIAPSRGTNEYDSTVHPVFLALNLSEIYTLTVALKSFTSKSVFSDTANDIADDVYRQLTEYGKEIIDKRAKEAGIQFGYSEGGYRKEIWADGRNAADEINKQKKRHRVYWLKSGSTCEIDYSDKNERMYGVLAFNPHDDSTVILVNKDGSEELLVWDRIVQIKRAGN